jgi:preprotein translocase subunit SecY
MRQKQSKPRLLQAMQDAFSLPDLRNRILITVLILVIFRFISHVPLPGINTEALTSVFQSNALLGMLDLFSGGAMKNFSVASMGVYPYITASIIIILLVPVIPKLQAMSQEGEAGKNKINMFTHWLTVPLAGLSGYGQLVLLQRTQVQLADGTTTFVIGSTTPLLTVTIVLTLIAGTLFLVWLGELITEYGIGNGISIIIFGGIVAGYPKTNPGRFPGEFKHGRVDRVRRHRPDNDCLNGNVHRSPPPRAGTICTQRLQGRPHVPPGRQYSYSITR